MYKLCNENSENEAQQWACGPDKQNNELKEAKQEHGAVGSSGDSTLWIDHLVREPFPVCFAVCDWYVDGDFYSFYLEQYIDSWANSLLARITSVLQTCLLPCKCKLEKKKNKGYFQSVQSQNGNFRRHTVAPGAVPREALLCLQHRHRDLRRITQLTVNGGYRAQA